MFEAQSGTCTISSCERVNDVGMSDGLASDGCNGRMRLSLRLREHMRRSGRSSDANPGTQVVVCV